MSEQSPSAPESAPHRSRLTAQQRRESILLAATDVFTELGYRRGKASLVAERVGVTEPVIFQNFGTKAALFAAVVRRAAEHTCATLEQRAGQVPVSDLLAALLEPEHLRHVHAAGSIGALFAEAATSDEPEIETAARDASQRFADTLENLLAVGQAAGEVTGALDPRAGAWWLLSLAASQRFRRATAADPYHVEALLSRATLDLFLGRSERPASYLNRVPDSED